MRRVRYAGGTFVTNDATATAVCDLAAALANNGRATALLVPAVDSAGRATEVQLVVGPASQVLSERIASSGDPLDSEEFVRDVREQIDRMSWHPTPVLVPRQLDDWDL